MAIKSQADQRRTQNMTDQHGRPYSIQVEKASGMPTCQAQYLFGVPHPSLLPPMKYMLFDPADVSHLTIDYPAWIRDEDAHLEEWEADRIRMSAMMPGVVYDPHRPPPQVLLVLLGPRPAGGMPIRAMQQNNAWALGLSEVKPPEARLFFPDPAVAPDDAVFSGPVFTQTVERVPGTEQAQGELLDAIWARCPADVPASQRHNWLVSELKRLRETAQPAGV